VALLWRRPSPKLTPMKMFLLSLLALGSVCLAAEPRAKDYMIGQVTRDIVPAVERAKSESKNVVLVTFDPKNDTTTNPHNLNGFFGLPETKKLLSENFIQVFTPWTSKGVSEYRDPADKTGFPVAIFLNSKGEVTSRIIFEFNPNDSLRRVQAIVSTARAQKVEDKK